MTRTQAPAALSVSEAVALYARGEFDSAVKNLNTQRLMVPQFTRALDAWIAGGDPSSAPRRRLVAAAFALDAGWHATRTMFNARLHNSDPWGHVEPRDIERWLLTSHWSQPIVARWAISQLPVSGTPDRTETTLWRAAVGFAEDGHAWNRLQNEILPLARKRLGDTPRLRLADVLARTNTDLGPLRSVSLATGWNAVLRDEQQIGGVTSRIPRAISAFEPLLADATLAGEVELRIGYLELRRRQWPAALTRFEAARAKSDEPVLRAAADYFAGWVHEQQGQPDEAIAAYRRAHAITPLMRNLTTRFSALMFLRNERAEAYALLDPALNARPAPTDLVVMLERADARFVPDWLASVRKALQ